MKKSIVRKIICAKQKIQERQIASCAKKNRYDLIAKKYRINEIVHMQSNRETAYNIRQNLYAHMLKKIAQKEKIKVAFVLYTASMWSCDDLYELFRRDDRFDPYIVLARYSLDSNLKTFPTFEKSKAFFDGTDKRYISVPVDTPARDCYNKMEKPDIVFYLTPYSTLLPVGLNQIYLPGSVLTVYIPYSYMLLDVKEKFRCPGMAASWRHFCDSKKYRELLIEDCEERKYDTLFCGYPKMDIYYEPCDKTKEEVWKIAPDADPKKVKCIIYAPHHSVPGTGSSCFHGGTFNQNFRFVLEYAKEHAATTSWIFKPHPNLKMTALEVGLFKSEEEYNAYIEEWNRLSNGYCVEEATYHDIFKTSDAMITDSVSFLVEYQFTGNPLLMLVGNKRKYNAFGEGLCDVLYRCQGDDYAAICRFLDDVVVEEKDTMKQMRKEFFEQNIAYMGEDGLTASEQIYKYITEAIWPH